MHQSMSARFSRPPFGPTPHCGFSPRRCSLIPSKWSKVKIVNYLIPHHVMNKKKLYFMVVYWKSEKQRVGMNTGNLQGEYLGAGWTR
jgi:hypothetical protein